MRIAAALLVGFVVGFLLQPATSQVMSSDMSWLTRWVAEIDTRVKRLEEAR